MSTDARVLIVDDEPANVRVLAETLKDRYALSFARDGEQALSLARRIPVDLILLDVVMPGMDGFAVLERLQGHPVTESVPVIFVTAMDELDDEARGLERGAVDYITKPISPAIVRARVKTHVELKRQRDLLSNLANIDGLTGLPNRRRLDREFDRHWARMQSGAGGVGLLMIDIDHFKQFNDRYGHAEGDRCLKEVAGVLQRVAGESNALAARYGGEEFAILCSPAAISLLAERLCQAVRELAIPHEISSAATHVTISVGCAIAEEVGDQEPASLFRIADRRLYQAKNQGRDQAVTGEP